MKINKHVCDICGKDLFRKYAPHPIRIKFKEYGNYSLFSWKKREICDYCARKIYDYCMKEED